MKSELETRFFLHLGYFPGTPNKFPYDFSNCDRSRYQGWVMRDLAEEGARLWRNMIGLDFERGKRNVVPLSGGLDSRAILAGLLECTEARNIETYTFGTPGTYDFDIGCSIAEEYGTKHTEIALDEFPWEEEDFVEASFRFNHQTLLFHHAPIRVLDQFADGVIWSGYLGDLLTGAHLPAKPSENLREARIRYVHDRREAKSMDISNGSTEEFMALLGGGGLSSDFLSFDEQIKFSEVAHFTLPHVLMRGFKYKTPFVNTPFWDFFLSVPDKARFGQKLYIEMLRTAWPDLFSIPCKSTYGLVPGASLEYVAFDRLKRRTQKIMREKLKFMNWPALPMTNYMDMDLVLRTDKNLRRIVRIQTDDLKQRQITPWIDIDGVWERHLSRQGNHGDVLKMLFSLEMNLKGLEKQATLSKVIGL